MTKSQRTTAIAVGAVAIAVIVAVLASRRMAKPDPPARAKFDAMTFEQQCAATAPRTEKCATEMIVAQLRELAPEASASGLEDDLRKEPSNAGEGRAIHKVNCSESPSYARAVMTCWNSDGCDALAKCVMADWRKTEDRAKTQCEAMSKRLQDCRAASRRPVTPDAAVAPDESQIAIDEAEADEPEPLRCRSPGLGVVIEPCAVETDCTLLAACIEKQRGSDY